MVQYECDDDDEEKAVKGFEEESLEVVILGVDVRPLKAHIQHHKKQPDLHSLLRPVNREVVLYHELDQQYQNPVAEKGGNKVTVHVARTPRRAVIKIQKTEHFRCHNRQNMTQFNLTQYIRTHRETPSSLDHNKKIRYLLVKLATKCCSEER